MIILPKRPTTRSVHGIALVSVLMVSVILLALAGAFFAAHKSDLALMGTSTKLESTKNAALSASEFFQYKLQNDRFFGTEPFPASDQKKESFPDGAAEPLLNVEYIGEGNAVSKNLVRGRITRTGLEFEGRVLNNLNNDAIATHPLGDAPPRSARVWITTKQGHIKKSMDLILKRSPFSSVSMLSGGDIDVSLTASENGHWWLGARQPSGNAVRANGTITGPEVLSSSGRAVLFEPPDGLGDKLDPPYGVIQGKYLNMQMDGVATEISSADERLEDVKDNIRGVLSPGGAEATIPKLDAEKLSSPTKQFTLPSNTLTFNTRETAPGKVVHELLDGNNTVLASYDGGAVGNRVFQWGDSPTNPAVTFDLEGRVMKVAENVELQTEDKFILRGTNSGNTEDSGQPTLILGNEAAGASIKANGIQVRGSVGGRGALKAGKGNLNIRAKSSLSTTPDFGVALHAEGDVVLSKPGSSKSDGIPSDWDAFAKALKSQEESEIDSWAGQDEATKNELTAEFSQVVLSRPGRSRAGSDQIWLGLTKNFPADEVAKETYEDWVRRPRKPVMGKDPNYEPPEAPPHPEVPVLDEEGNPITNEEGEVVTQPDPEWEWTPPEPEDVELVPAVPAGPGMSVEKYVRMREYLKTLKDGNPDKTWLRSSDPTVESARRRDALNLVKNQLSSFQLAAGQIAEEKNGQVTLSWRKLSEYFSGKNPFLSGYSADMSFRGLIYAGGDFIFDTKKQGFEIEGALVAHGDIRITDATGAKFIYNSDLLEKLFTTNEGDNSAKLVRSYWAYY